METISRVSSKAHEAPATDVDLETESTAAGVGEKNDDRELRERVPCDFQDLAHWKVELAEIASLATDIDISLRRARASMVGLSDSVDEIASRAFDAERSLRDAQDRIRALSTP
jgi:hypothetical protein